MFILEKINNEIIIQYFCFLLLFFIRIEILEIYVFDKLQIIVDIDIEYGILNGLCKVLCFNDNEMWICGNDSIM